MTRPIPYRLWLSAFVLSLGACQPSGAQAPLPKPTPSDEQLANAFHPTHLAATGTRSECLGRLVFEVTATPEFEWGLPKNVRNNQANMGFSRILKVGGETILMANVGVLVAANANHHTIEEMQRITGVHKNIAMQDFDENIRVAKLVSIRLKNAIEEPDLKSDPEKTADYKKGIEEVEQEIADYERRKQNLDKDWHPTDWGLSDSTGYIAGPTLYAFVLRNGFAFQFMSTGGEGEAPFDQRVTAFKDLLSRFEYRPLYQVPTGPGLCIPHGFIRDDGKGHFRANVSYRFTDSPGVIYTLSTGVEGERNYQPNAPMIEATARSAFSGAMGGANGRQLKIIGPKTANIGARQGMLGGIHTTEGTHGYSVYAGVSGWTGSHVLPHISLNMRSFDRATAPDDVKVDPPPFEQSMQRFELTLGSLRTRKSQ